MTRPLSFLYRRVAFVCCSVVWDAYTWPPRGHRYQSWKVVWHPLMKRTNLLSRRWRRLLSRRCQDEDACLVEEEDKDSSTLSTASFSNFSRCASRIRGRFSAQKIKSDAYSGDIEARFLVQVSRAFLNSLSDGTAAPCIQYYTTGAILIPRAIPRKYINLRGITKILIIKLKLKFRVNMYAEFVRGKFARNTSWYILTCMLNAIMGIFW